jgi:hypothetical protein
MLKQRRDSPSVLAIYPTSRGYAFVLFESPLTPHDWGTKDIKQDAGCALSITSIKEMLLRYRPDVLVVEDAYEHGTKRSFRMSRIHRAITDFAHAHSIDVAIIKRSEVRAAFATMGAITKYDIAKCIASKIDAFAGLAPRARKAWETEDRRMALFDAASRALTYYYKLANVDDASED